MAIRKSLLKRNMVEVAQRMRKCKNSQAKISSGQKCLVVFDGPRDRFCYSREIGLKMVEDARLSLKEIELQLIDGSLQPQ
jgi:hypothetical protein